MAGKKVWKRRFLLLRQTWKGTAERARRVSLEVRCYRDKLERAERLGDEGWRRLREIAELAEAALQPRPDRPMTERMREILNLARPTVADKDAADIAAPGEVVERAAVVDHERGGVRIVGLKPLPPGGVEGEFERLKGEVDVLRERVRGALHELAGRGVLSVAETRRVRSVLRGETDPPASSPSPASAAAPGGNGDGGHLVASPEAASAAAVGEGERGHAD